MKKNDLAIAIIKEFSDKDGRCKFSKKKLGEILHQRHPTEFKDAEHGRKIVRAATGSNGKHHRDHYPTQIEWKGLSLPEPEKNDFTKYILKSRRVGVLSDIHFPYYDYEALSAAIKYLHDWEPDCILLNGDIIDCYQISDFVKDVRKPSFVYELGILKQFIEQLRYLFPKVKIVYKLGNHEERYEKRIMSRLPELVDLKWTKFDDMLKAEGFDNVEIVKNKRIIQLGKLNIVHGHELPHGIAAPVNPARGFFLRAKANTLGGHHHQTSDHSEPDLNSNVIGTWSTGCLCDLHPDYMPVNRWNHGFATVENFGAEFTVKNLRIINGKVL